MRETEYLSAAATAKLVRLALKKAFPGAAFSVRSKTYAGGASIGIGWTDGPCGAAVETVSGPFSGAQFDGSIDLKTTHRSWLLPDGTAQVAHASGTVGSMGMLSAADNAKPHADARLVQFGANFIFCQRATSAALLRRVVDRLTHQGLPTEVLEITERHGHAWVRQSSHDRARTRGFDMEREMHQAIRRTHCGAPRQT